MTLNCNPEHFGLSPEVTSSQWDAYPTNLKEEKGPSTHLVAERLRRKFPVALDASGRLYVYQDGLYRVKGERIVESEVKRLHRKWNKGWCWTSYRGKEVVKYLATDAPLLWEKPPLDQINVVNGRLNLATGQLAPHSPEWFSPIHIPVRFDPTATCPTIDEFVESCFPEDGTHVAYELATDILTPDRSCQKAVLLFGPGGNGKSTYLALLSAFVGDGNVSAVSLHDLERNRFAAARLHGKLANICPDLPSAELVGTSVFKSITGGDRLTGEHKFCPSFEFTPYARLIFSTNHLPKSPDLTAAFWDRWLIIPFTKSFRGTAQEHRREDLDKRLQNPQELSGLLNKVVEVWPRLRQRGFTVSPLMKDAVQQFQDEGDFVAGFVRRCLTLDPQGVEPKSGIYQAYAQEAELAEQQVLPTTTFWKRCKQLCPDIQEKQRTIQGKVERVWVGIRLHPAIS